MSTHNCEQLLSEILAKQRAVQEAGVSKSTKRVMRDLQEALTAAHAAMGDIATTVQEMREEKTDSTAVETDVAPAAKKPKRTNRSSEWNVFTKVLSAALSGSDEDAQDKSMCKISKVASVLKTTFPTMVSDIFRQASDRWKPSDASILQPSHMNKDRVSWNAWVQTLRAQAALAPLFAQMQELRSQPRT